MILKINNNGISIDVSFSPEAVSDFDAKKATITKSSINDFKVFDYPPTGEEVISLRDIEGNTYRTKCENIVSINGEPGLAIDPNSLYNTNDKVYNKINELLLGL